MRESSVMDRALALALALAANVLTHEPTNRYPKRKYWVLTFAIAIALPLDVYRVSLAI